jgi:hypothetical protein
MSEANAEQILQWYATRVEIPHLSDEELTVIKPYVREKLVNVAGVLPLKNGTDESTRAELKNQMDHLKHDDGNEIVVGPYLLEDTYYPDGIGIFLTRGADERSRTSTPEGTSS